MEFAIGSEAAAAKYPRAYNFLYFLISMILFRAVFRPKQAYITDFIGVI